MFSDLAGVEGIQPGKDQEFFHPANSMDARSASVTCSESMSGIPHKQSLMVQAAGWIRSEIERGAWGEWLPGERVLAEKLQISRNTLRTAIQQLIEAGLIRAEHGLGNRVLAKPAKAAPPRERIVGLLTPDPLEQLRPTQTLWIDQLRVLLVQHDCRLDVVQGQHYFRGRPGKALKKLTDQHPYSCWILMRASETAQAWFQRNAVPSVVAGSTWPQIDLPCVDVDHGALCRHAAGALLRAGHRSIALIAERTHRAGDAESEMGFVEGVRSSPHTDAEALVAWHEPSVESVCSALRRLMRFQRPPTALLVANPFFYLTVTSRLAKMGWRIPENISVISRDEDAFLSFLIPCPARYAVPAHVFAKKLLKPVIELLEGEPLSVRKVRIMPEFLPGDSLGPLPDPRGAKEPESLV